MGNVNRPQLQAWLLELHQGTLPFESDDFDVDTYIERVEAEGIGHQVQLRAAHDLLKKKVLTSDDYQMIRLQLDDWYKAEHKAHRGSAKVFNPFAVKSGSPLFFDQEAFEAYSRGEITLDEYTNRLGVTAATGKVPEATGTKRKGRKSKAADPLRSKTGRFLPGVAELWFYDPETGLLGNRVYLAEGTPKTETVTFTGVGIKGASPSKPHVVEYVTGPSAIAKAFRKAAEIQATWRSMGLNEAAVWVKFRYGDMKGNRHVVLASAMGMLCNPQDIVRLQRQALGMGIKSKVGEKMCKTKQKHIELMLAQNRVVRQSLGFDEQIGKVKSGQNLDIPTAEPKDPNAIAYTVKYRSRQYDEVDGTLIQHDELPLSDDLDEDGNVILPGHKKMAYHLLLNSAADRADSPMTCRYAVYGKKEDEVPQTFVIGRDEAARWDMGPEDEALLELRKRFKAGELDSEEYMQARHKRLNILEPPEPKRAKQTTTSGRVNLEYNSDGTLNWQKAQNDTGPGMRWVGGMSYLDAQLYNMPAD